MQEQEGRVRGSKNGEGRGDMWVSREGTQVLGVGRGGAAVLPREKGSLSQCCAVTEIQQEFKIHGATVRA